MDGELYPLVLDWIRSTCAVDHVNLITEASLDRRLLNIPDLERILKKFRDLTKDQDHTTGLFLVGYEGSINEELRKDARRDRFRKAAAALQRRLKDHRVVCLWVSEQLQITTLRETAS